MVLPLSPSDLASGVAADFTSVSCVANHYCIATGAVVGPKDNQSEPLLELRDGTSWRLEKSRAERG
jgi:hypothetical protein